ncbi:type I restriction endonuclease subunit R [Pyxidicoccus sp. MSG2]|uniref:type I restriction endonuclease subunit R n=1 Tax=Pyxidicoccus sp. MSG2 TaxID=2996790 RepID=UPI0022718DA8|nr:HsdR family type I site-specific deoxyribonuclease [Pyxidicoccus sp. MSG2]MCY1019691.1 HsdR family type I site-specific deoxyribonuclease [Pyxidicoccus sp. MSG2]
MALSLYLEDLDSQLPAVQLLHSLGWQYISREEALRLRGGRQDQVVLTEVLRPWLEHNNQIEAKGKTFSFSPVHLSEAIRRLTDEPYEGLVRTNEKIYNLLTLGTSVDVEVESDRKGRQIHYIDWLDSKKNVYHVTDEFSVERSKSHETSRPDLVLFINGIPVVAIECKRRDMDQQAGDKAIERAIKQLITYQKDDHIPRLFQYAQLLFATSVNDCRYGTVGTPMKFWSVWREEGDYEQSVHAAVNQRLPEPVEAALFAPADSKHAKAYSAARLWWRERMLNGDRLPTEQDRTLWAMLRPTRLLEFIRDAVVFDAGVRKVARYQQWFAVRATLDRVTGMHEGLREGGVIWHTTGSGKSLTMVMLAKAIALHPGIKSPRVVLVTDRDDLDRQLADTFAACGKTAERARTGEHLVRLITENKATVISAIINKFATAMAKHQAKDQSTNIFVMVDEGHRSNYGTFAAQMRRVFPNACYIGFTGTPLLKREKDTARKFGGFIHSYSMKQAVDDKAVVPLIYEGRMALLQQNDNAVNAWFDRLTEGLTRAQKAELKRGLARREVLEETPERIKLISYDISQHYKKNFQGRGLKGQVAARSRTSAIRYRRFMQEFGLVRAEVIMSPPDLRGDAESIEEDQSLVEAFWSEMMKRFRTEEDYNKQIKASFAREDGEVELIIVVDKLLTGFDEPRNSVLYIDKSLREHNILQAIARVNRLFSGKDYGYIVDYRGILGELNEAMQTYEELAGFDAADIDLLGSVIDISKVIKDLPQHHADIWAVFKEVRNKSDNEAMERHLAPDNRREAFYAALRSFQKTLSAALASERLYDLVPKQRVDAYKQDFKRFVSLRASVQSRYADRVDYGQYERQLKKMMESHIQAPEVNIITPEVNIFDEEAFDREVEKHETKASKADTIANRISKTCREKMEEDPFFYMKFAALVQQAIDDYREARISELEYLKRVEEYLETLRQGHEEELPAELDGAEHVEARAFFGVLGEALESAEVTGAPTGKAGHRERRRLAARLALEIVQAVKQRKIRDWAKSPDAVKSVEDSIDDYLFDARARNGIGWSTQDIDRVLQRVMAILKKLATMAHA